MLNCDGDEPTGPEPYKGVWEWVPTPKCLASVNDIYFVSANDGWAVAGHQIWHYDGASWKLFKELRPADPRYDYGLTQVWFNGPNDGWVAGIENRTYSVYVSHMWHYDGGEWARCPAKFSEVIYDIDFFSPDYGCTVGNVTFVYDRGEWKKVEQPPVNLWCVECVGPNDIWAGTDTGDIYHFTGFG